MAVTNLYPNLPGHLVEFKDGGLQLTNDTNSNSSKKSLLILGTAFDGPINEPVKIDKDTVSQLFGSEVNDKGYPNGATLTKYAKQAFKNGFNDVRCMRVTGSLASVELKKNVVTSTEEVEARSTGIIAGNAEQEFDTQVKADVFISATANAVGGTGSALSISTKTGSNGNAFVVVPANHVTKNSQLNVNVDYKKINTATPVTQAITSDATNSDHVTLTPQSGQTIDVDSISVKIDSAPATKDTEYTVATAGDIVTITFNDSDPTVQAAIAASDNVTVDYKYSTVANTSLSIQLVDTPQVITLPNTPVTGSVSIATAGGAAVASSKFTVTGKDVSINAGALDINTEVIITYKYEVSETKADKMTIRSIYGGTIYNQASVEITPMTNDDGEHGLKFKFTKPDSKLYSNADKPFFFTSFECPTVGTLKQALANYALNNVFEIIADDEDIETKDFDLFSGNLEGGEDGVVVTANQMFEALSGKRNQEGYLVEQGAYQILENYNVDYIYPAGVYANMKQTVNPHSNFHNELALVCAVLTYRTKMTHGFIDVKPNSNTTLVGIQQYVDKLLAYDNTHYMMDAEGNDIVDKEGNKMDIGWYTSVVVGPEPVMVSDTLGTYYGSPAIAYAALNASLKPQSAPTNKALPGVKGMKYKFSNKQMNDLIGNRMVVFKLKNEGTTTASSVPYVVDGCTAGAEGCDYARLSTVKIVTDVVDQIREVADPFIGEPNTVEQRNALSALISKRLGNLLEQGEIQYYEFEINATIQQVVLGECSIALTLVCPMELRKITTVVALRAAA